MNTQIPPRNRRWWRGISAKLFLSYVIVSAFGVATLFLGVSYLAPTIFDRSMANMMGGYSTGGMMGSYNTGGMMGNLSQAANADISRSFRQSVNSSLYLASSVALLAALVASYLFAQRIIRPLQKMSVAAHRIAGGRYFERVPDGAKDEIGDLGESFNMMATALEETEKRRLTLIGDVAHELRTPLSTISGYAEGLMDGVVANSPETFALIQREAQRLSRLVNDLQELSRAEARQLSLHPRSLETNKLVDAVVGRLSPQFNEKGVGLAVNLADHLPSVYADEDRTNQILTNLVGNALRYTGAGGKVSVRVVRRPQFVEFSVADTGIGIAPVHIPHLFERFYRADPSRSRAAGGSGIGLTIAHHLVEAQGGTLRAESDGPGRGATFIFTLPIAG